MNPLLGRLFENRTRSKTKPIQSEEHRRNQSFERTLVPKLPTKIKLESLPEAQVEKRMSTLARSNMGILPVLNLNMTHDVRENIKTRTKLRRRKLSTTIKDMQANIFTTQLEDKILMQITPQLDVKMFEVQSKQKEQVSRLQDKPQKRQQREEEVFQYLKVLQNHADLNEEFCYMNRKQLPYSFYIVDYDDRDKDEHLTVSLRGITYYNHDQNEFYTISKFAQEIQRYKQIKQIYFFRQYVKSKVINHWKRIMLRRKFNLKCKHITSHLFSQNQQIQEYLHFLHYLAEDYSGGSFFNFNITLTLPLASFIKTAETGSNQIMKSIRKFDHLIEKTLKNTLQKMLTRFRTDERVTIGSEKHSQQDQAYLPFDSKRRSMKYTQMAKLKEFEWMMYRIIKYTDMVRFNVKLEIIRKCFANSIVQLCSLKKASQSKEAVRFTTGSK